ncbi:hypothetical protein DIPPA_17293 [Diplonema papillatum]|nr:hypothetical protein DIPPA_17293 [Diplonema papillatum]
MLHTADACLQHDMPMCGVGGKETEARAFAPGDARATPKSRRRLRPSAQSATREAADAGANTAIENAEDKRRKDSPSSKTETCTPRRAEVKIRYQ